MPNRLEEIAVAKQKLFFQLEELNMQERAVQLEHNVMHNLDAPTSNLPDEILAMIFEAGSCFGLPPKYHFGELVSHVSHRWRRIALTTPWLWAEIRVATKQSNFPWPLMSGQLEERPKIGFKSLTESVAHYLSRSKSIPVEIYFSDFCDRDVAPDLLKILGHHNGHFQSFNLFTRKSKNLEQILESVSHQEATLLESFSVGETKEMQFTSRLFPHGAPRLRTVHLHSFDITTSPLCLPAFGSVSHLKLSNLNIEDRVAYGCFRGFLGALQTLSHLELSILFFAQLDLLPIVLPSLLFFMLDAVACPAAFNYLINALHAPSLTSLSLNRLDESEELTQPTISHFPSLQHLILTQALSQFAMLATVFPNIERLTCCLVEDEDVDDLVDAIFYGDGGPLKWPKMRSIAVSVSQVDSFDVSQLCNLVEELQIGRSMRKLLLPKSHIAKMDVCEMEELREMIEVEEFIDEWSLPFQRLF
ncbi:hypothetical protein HWV62_44814 [Athelia sp. TMB]|nr:hypothetical protein HWV62_44814 [Athelia sp. TMB]